MLVAGPGSGLSEESALGRESVALESESLPRCPPGPVAEAWSRRCWSASIRSNTTLDRRRFRGRMATIDGVPPAVLAS